MQSSVRVQISLVGHKVRKCDEQPPSARLSLWLDLEAE
jgi:hypothetical protein